MYRYKEQYLNDMEYIMVWNRFLLLILISVFCIPAFAELEVPERRKSQFFTDSGYYVVPTPYSIPGIGEGLIVVGAMTNFYNDYSDLYGFFAGGDLQGAGVFSTENHIFEKELIVDFAIQSFNKASSQLYRQRGMGSDAEDYILAELDNALFYGSRITYTLFDRRLEFYGLLFEDESQAGALRNQDGSLIQSSEDGKKDTSIRYTVGVRLDLTDDYSDPRKGLRFEGSYWYSPPKDDDAPDYSIVDWNLTGYIPFRDNDTLVLNYFQADAHVNTQGETDSAILQSEYFDCSLPTLTAQEQQDCLSFINNTIAHNSFGSVGDLGGLSRLRSFPEGRFKGSHARFYGLEYRWNINDEEKPFDIFIARDIRTVMQVAFFYERGAIADDKSELWDEMVYSVGVGFRLITSSGLVFRADIAKGEEGNEVSIIIGYPWEVF